MKMEGFGDNPWTRFLPDPAHNPNKVPVKLKRNLTYPEVYKHPPEKFLLDKLSIDNPGMSISTKPEQANSFLGHYPIFKRNSKPFRNYKKYSQSGYPPSSFGRKLSPIQPFQKLFTLSILLLIICNQEMVGHVEGQQVWSPSDPSQLPAGFSQQQYASFEELQRLTENPFENNTAVNLTVPLGDNAFLRCKARNLGERSISWVRRRDWHILTSGKTTYTNDERFNVLHADGSNDWTLQIKFVQKRDNGTYECQVSTGAGIVSYLVHLLVAVPEAFILGNGEYHVEQGSTINLVCVIEKSPKPPEYIFWYHNDRMINYGSSREVKVHNEPGSKTHSRLTIRDAQLSDSGNYTCKTAHAEPASTLVYVSQGDQMAAIQKRKAAAEASQTSSLASSVSSSASKTQFNLIFKANLLNSSILSLLLVPSLIYLFSHLIN